MIIRSARLQGEVAPEHQAEFEAYMRKTVLPSILEYPGIRGVSLRRLIETDAGAEPIYMQFDMMFDSVEAMNAALASPVRQSVQATIKAGMGSFKGHVIHTVSEQL